MAAPDPLTISLETILAAAPMLGHRLEDRSSVRDAQDRTLVARFAEASSLPLGLPYDENLFLVAPLDILVVNAGGRRQFHITETNGTGIGGLTNLTEEAVATVLDGLTRMARDLTEPNALVLVAVSGVESKENPRQNKLLHEKMLYVEALKRGFESRGESVRVLTMARLLDDAQGEIVADQPTVVLGYIKELLENLELTDAGRLTLFGRPVSAGVNDRFCLNVVTKFAGLVDLTKFSTMNRCFVAGADKGVAYELLNEFARGGRHGPLFPEEVRFARAHNRQELVARVVEWVKAGRKCLIKAQGTGLGHGIEFFLDRDEPVASILAKVDASVRLTEDYYGLVGGAFPYTLCEFVDTCTIQRSGHALYGHKYELRIVVYRDGAALKAFPSIAKISSHGYDADAPEKLSLINNITASAEATKNAGVDFMVPLCSHETLELLGISLGEMDGLSAFCTGFVGYILEQMRLEPQRLGLPRAREATLNGMAP